MTESERPMFAAAGFPSAEIQFDRSSGVVGTAEGLLSLATSHEISDLVIMSHGWNNDIADARSLYAGLAMALRSVLTEHDVSLAAERHVGLAAVFWPSKKFADSDLIPGGAAAIDSSVAERQVQAAIDELRDVFSDPTEQAALQKARDLVPKLEDDPDVGEEFIDLLRSLVSSGASDEEDGTRQLLTEDAKELMNRLSDPVIVAPAEWTAGGAAGDGDDIGLDETVDALAAAGWLTGALGSAFGAAKNALSLFTYYEMKARAGVIGAKGLAPLLTDIRKRRGDLRIHLVGHSFGGRLVTAAANALDRDAINTMTLLQAAFSHFGFAEEWRRGRDGGFRDVVNHEVISGPVLITHSVKDLAVGLLYALASRVAGQACAGLGDANDTFGGIGRNGAQKTPEAVAAELLSVRGSYAWQPHKLHNLKADNFIRSHSDIEGKEVAYAILSAIASV